MKIDLIELIVSFDLKGQKKSIIKFVKVHTIHDINFLMDPIFNGKKIYTTYGPKFSC